MNNTEDILKHFKIELVYNHAIYFIKFEDTAFGVLAEDTIYMIRNFGKHEEITIEEIESNLEALEQIIVSDSF